MKLNRIFLMNDAGQTVDSRRILVPGVCPMCDGRKTIIGGVECNRCHGSGKDPNYKPKTDDFTAQDLVQLVLERLFSPKEMAPVGAALKMLSAEVDRLKRRLGSVDTSLVTIQRNLAGIAAIAINSLQAMKIERSHC